MANDKRGDLKKYFSANMIPTQDHFHALIDEIFMFHDNGLKRLKDEPLKLDDGAQWSLSLNSGSRSGLSIEDKNGSRIFIDESTKSIGIGTTELKPGSILHVKGNLHVDGDLHVNGAAKREGGKTNWDSGPSDARLKDFSELSGSLEKIKRLRGVSYKWKSGSPDNVEHFGLIAQDLENVDELKCWVGKTGDGYLNIEPTDGGHQLEALTIQALKELDSKISSVILADGSIKAAGQQGLLFAAADGATEAAWLGCSVQGANYSLEIRAAGGIELNAASSALVLQKRGGGTVVGGPLTAQGNIATSGSLAASGAIQPSAGNSEANGIMFPKNPGGGSGDGAWIRYYPVSGENTIFEIGTSNDRSDHIFLNASGNVGINTINPRHKLHIIGNMHTVGDIILGVDEDNKRFIFHSRTNGNGDFLQITHDSAREGWDWGQGITIRRGGNVGIGTTNPAAKLHVANGNLRVDGVARIGGWEEQNLSPNGGYVRIGQLLIQWGTHSVNNDNEYPVYFPKSFSAACFSVVTNRQESGAESPIYAIKITKDKFSVDRENGIDGTQTINWIAVGV